MLIIISHDFAGKPLESRQQPSGSVPAVQKSRWHFFVGTVVHIINLKTSSLDQESVF